MRRTLVLVLAMGLLLGACSKKGETETAGSETSAGGGCGPVPSALATVPSVAAAFPGPSDIVVTDVSPAGPSTIVTGVVNDDLEGVYGDYKSALSTGGYTVTSSEKEEDDAEVNFSGNSTTGQVKLTVPCEGRTDVSITIRPA
ncbi:MAG: hypothetical protein M3Q23_08410 [Actinomycetota bacterium]|nr:hypothetical protein [Actinomycetota bacterium]